MLRRISLRPACRSERFGRSFSRRKVRNEGISDRFWNEIEDDGDIWYWKGKKIYRDEFWDYLYDVYRDYLDEGETDIDDFDEWVEAQGEEWVDAELENLFYMGGADDDRLDFTIWDVDSEFRKWFEKYFNGTRYTVAQMKKLISKKAVWDELQAIFDKYTKIKEVGGFESLKLPDIKKIKDELLEIATECGGAHFEECDQISMNRGFGMVVVSYGLDGVSMMEFSIDIDYDAAYGWD